MGHYRVALLFCVLPVILASCNLPSSPSDASEDGTLPDITDVPPSPLPADSEGDSCIVGEWWMYTAELDLLVATLVPMPNIRVPDGNLFMLFSADGVFDYTGSLTLRVDLNPSENQYLEGIGAFHTGGTYATEGGTTLLLDQTSSETEVFEWHAYKNGQSYEAPGLGPTFSLNPPGAAPYRCTSTSLEIDTQGPSGTVTMFFSK